MYLSGNIFAALLFLSVPSDNPSPDHALSALDTRATETLKLMAEHLQSQKRISVTADGRLVMQTQGMRNERSGTFSATLDRPDKLALRYTNGLYGTTLVSDSTTVTKYRHADDAYSLTAAPSDTDALLEQIPSQTGMAMDASSILAKMLSSKAYDRIMENVTTATFVGDEDLDGTATAHIRIAEGEILSDLWVRADETHVPVKMQIDLSPLMQRSGGSHPMMKNMRMTGEFNFHSWNFNPSINSDTFSYTPPESATLKEEEQHEEEEPSPLLGKPAPDFKLPLLTGGEFELASHKGKVVVLDFWATWCGPCVQGLPVVSAATLKLHDQGVEFLAVNQREEAEEVQKFLKNEKLVIPVALDKEGEVGDKYLVEGIPQTVLIGKDGTVQVVHVGFGPGMGARLESELKDLLAGKKLAVETTGTTTSRARRSESGGGGSGGLRDVEDTTTKPMTPKKTPMAAPDTATSKGVTQTWSIDGAWIAVAGDRAGNTAFAINRKGEGTSVNAQGKTSGAVKFPELYSSIRLADIEAGGESELLAFQYGGPWVRAFDLKGKELWSHEESGSLNDIVAFDINGDGSDELLEARNGTTGIYAVSAKGETLWKHEDLTNVQRITGGRLQDEAGSCVVAASLDGTLRAFDTKGENFRDLKAPGKITSVRCVSVTTGVVLLAGGRGKPRGSKEEFELMMCLNTDGTVNWSTPIGSIKSRQDAISVSADSQLAALSMRGGVIHILRMADGALVGTIPGQGMRPEVAWLTDQKSGRPLLLIATGNRLNAYRLN